MNAAQLIFNLVVSVTTCFNGLTYKYTYFRPFYKATTSLTRSTACTFSHPLPHALRTRLTRFHRMQSIIVSRFLLNLRRANANTNTFDGSEQLSSRASGLVFMPNATTVLGNMGEPLEVGSFVERDDEAHEDYWPHEGESVKQSRSRYSVGDSVGAERFSMS